MRIKWLAGATLAVFLVPVCCDANDPATDCPTAIVVEHVRQQVARYAPLSVRREYFGFIYERGGMIESAVARGPTCPDPTSCGVDTRAAARELPRRVRILGEWHTHPSRGSAVLSSDDVLGAHGNQRIRCYTAFYAGPDGSIYSWDPRQDSVHTAMASRQPIAANQPNGLSSEVGGTENQTGFSGPMWRQSSSRMPNLPGR